MNIVKAIYGILLMSILCSASCSKSVHSKPGPEPPVDTVKPGPPAPALTLPFGVNLAGAEFSEDKLPGIHGTDYFYPTVEELDYFKRKGLKLIRLPFRWERIQPVIGGSLDATELSRIKKIIEAAGERGMMILPDMHNYGRRKVGDNFAIIGSSQLSVANAADAWYKLANELKLYTNIWGYGLMNEPHDMLQHVPWVSIAQAIINEIRKADTKTHIVVGGDGWSSAAKWLELSDNLKTLVDPSDKIIYEAHVYFDRNASGAYEGSYDAEGATDMKGVERIYHFVRWIKENDKKGFIGEYGVPSDDQRWLTTLDNMLKFLAENNINGTCWAAGPQWGNYKLSVEPANNTDKPQMGILSKYPSSNTDNISATKNLARQSNVVVTASGFTNESESPDKAKDGNYKTKWCDNVATRDKWIQYDLGKAVRIDRVMLEWENWDITKKFTIKTSQDGSTWTDAIAETNSNEALKIFNVSWSQVRYVRLLINAADDDVVRLTEMELWGD